MTGVTPDCRCAGRGQGRHDLLCKSVLRDVFGHLGNVPPDIKGMLRERGTVVPDAPPGGHPGSTETRPVRPRRPGNAAGLRAVWPPEEITLAGSPEPGLPARVPERACQVTVRYSSVSGHEILDIVVMTDDYQLRRDDGTLDAYLEAVVRPVLKRTWYPFPVDTGDRWVLPVVLRGGKYVEDPEAPNPLDASSVSFPAAAPQPVAARTARPAAVPVPRRLGARPHTA